MADNTYQFIDHESNFATMIADRTNVLAELPDEAFQDAEVDEVLVATSDTDSDVLSMWSVGDGHDAWRGTDLDIARVRQLRDTLNAWLADR